MKRIENVKRYNLRDFDDGLKDKDCKPLPIIEASPILEALPY